MLIWFVNCLGMVIALYSFNNIFLYFISFTAAVKATKSSKFGSVPENFIMDNVNCLGNESSLLVMARTVVRAMQQEWFALIIMVF